MQNTTSNITIITKNNNNNSAQIFGHSLTVITSLLIYMKFEVKLLDESMFMDNNFIRLTHNFFYNFYSGILDFRNSE